MSSCENILEEIEKINQEIYSTIKDHETHIKNYVDVKTNLEDKVCIVDRLSNEVVYQMWVAKIDLLRLVIISIHILFHIIFLY